MGNEQRRVMLKLLSELHHKTLGKILKRATLYEYTEM